MITLSIRLRGSSNVTKLKSTWVGFSLVCGLGLRFGWIRFQSINSRLLDAHQLDLIPFQYAQCEWHSFNCAYGFGKPCCYSLGRFLAMHLGSDRSHFCRLKKHDQSLALAKICLAFYLVVGAIGLGHPCGWLCFASVQFGLGWALLGNTRHALNCCIALLLRAKAQVGECWQPTNTSQISWIRNMARFSHGFDSFRHSLQCHLALVGHCCHVHQCGEWAGWKNALKAFESTREC